MSKLFWISLKQMLYVIVPYAITTCICIALAESKTALSIGIVYVYNVCIHIILLIILATPIAKAVLASVKVNVIYVIVPYAFTSSTLL